MARFRVPLEGVCRVCKRATLANAHLCARCWNVVPRCFRNAVADATMAEQLGRGDFGTLKRHRRTALVACEIAARIFVEDS